MNNSTNKTKMQFNKVAEEYDFMESLFDNSKFFVLEMSDNKGSALDIGCGSGILAYKLSKYYDKVIGIDISEEMLHIASSKRQSLNIKYINMDANELKLYEKFDLITSRTTFHHINDIPLLITKIKDMVNPGGKIVIVDVISNFEKEPTIFSIIEAFSRLIPNCKMFGVKIGFRIFKFNISKDWLKHLASDRYLSEQKFKNLFTTYLPGCRISKNGYQMQVIWENKNI
ncbi:class I SAM-dependent methyltransferase [Clostridium estertheticum]|uniref:class I SAM-dependent methyltransferase n=1 Tax=Clostridium estertheticum TaxID=238834 RepID=UPI0013E908B4|nr:class I SAM-dependent methyltransferase [Clostridium estertheticum]MBZ9685528.1 class I SAM-dependent methyltransferase [Clostridium estertheticum]